MNKSPWNKNKSVGQRIRQFFCKHEFTLPWEIKEPFWAKQTVPNAICHKCGKGQKFEIRIIGSEAILNKDGQKIWSICDPFDIGEKHD